MRSSLLPALLLFLATAAYAQPREIRVEIDYMVAAGHSHEPSQDEIDAVVQMFACQGITLIVEIDDAIPHANVMRRDPLNANNFFGYNAGLDTFGGIKDRYQDNLFGWHYAVFGHQYQNKDYQTSGSSGLGELPGDDFIVTLGDFENQIGTAWDRAGTFAHELGHNLGLGHAGAQDPGDVGAYVPNVPSVMTYFSQLAGVRSAMQCANVISDDPGETLFKELDYSHGRACSLDERALSEDFGMGIIPVDWNCDGSIGGTVMQDVGEQRGGWCGSTAGLDALSDYDEWASIEDVAALPEYLRPPSVEVACVTADEMAAYRAHLAEQADAGRGGCTQPSPVIESCPSARMSYVDPRGSGETGSCRLPYPNLQAAHDASEDGDILYIAPGTYPDAGVVLDKTLLLLGPGGGVAGQ